MRNRWLWGVLFLSLLPFIPTLLNPLSPHTQDGSVHFARMAAHFKALSDGQFPPRWAADLNYGYGMPLFIFMYPLPYFLTSFFIFLGASLVLSFKLVIVLSFLLSGIFMFLFAKEFFGEEKIAFFVTLFYQFAPFRFVEANVRGDIGEIYTYTFLPLVLLGISRFFKKGRMVEFLLTAFAAALLIISHNSISLVFFIIALGFVLFFGRNIRQKIITVVALTFGMALSAFYWLPALLEHKFTYGELFMRDVYKDYFTPLSKLFLPNFNNSHSLNMGDVPVQIGIFHIGALIVSLFVLWKIKKLKPDLRRLFPFLWGIILVALFFTQPISTIFWEKISLLRQFQFPWRFLAPIVFASSLLAGSAFSLMKVAKNNFLYGSVLVLMTFSTINYWKTPFGFEKINEQDFWNFPLTTTYYGETDLIWSEGPAKAYPAKRIEIIDGKGEISGIDNEQTTHKFKVAAQTAVNIVDRTQYFPGWRVFADGEEVPIQFQDPNQRGLITFNLPAGEHEVLVKFGRTKDRTVAELVTVISFLLLLALLTKSLLFRRNLR